MNSKIFLGISYVWLSIGCIASLYLLFSSASVVLIVSAIFATLVIFLLLLWGASVLEHLENISHLLETKPASDSNSILDKSDEEPLAVEPFDADALDFLRSEPRK